MESFDTSDKERKVIVIAEAGVNHNGDMQNACRLIDIASEAGADYVKFQTYRTENLVVTDCKKAEYQRKNIGGDDDSQYRMLKSLELSREQHFVLIEHCRKKGVKFLSSAFDLDSVDFLKELNLDFWKIPSGEITNYPYLKRIAQSGKTVIMSTGMSTEKEIEMALEVLLNNGLKKENIVLLHCNTEYPTPVEDVNLMAMNELANKFDVEVGYSDHTEGIEVAIAAVALGARVIEKHFTIDRNMIGPDHKASLELDDLKRMVAAIRNVEKALGDGHKTVTQSEAKNIGIARKSIVAAKDIRLGEILTEENVTVKRPGGGLSPMMWESVVGRKAKRDFCIDEMIEL